MKALLNYLLSKEIKQHICCEVIKSKLTLFGYDASKVTDKEINVVVDIIAKMISQLGLEGVRASKAGVALKKEFIKKKEKETVRMF